MMTDHTPPIPPSRLEGIERFGALLRSGMRVALSTHVNADGDGCGSQIALGHVLLHFGTHPVIVNPTPWPYNFDFLRSDRIPDLSDSGAAALEGVDMLVVLDISDVSRLGVLTDKVRSLGVPKLCIDHHQPGSEPPGELVLDDTTACATGELIYDLATGLGVPMTAEIATALYTAILTDTGGFRFSNTSPRCHAVAGALLAAGVDPERMYREVYASVPVGRLRLLRDALESLQVDSEAGISWMCVTARAVANSGARSEDMDGIVEHARSVKGTRLAMFFRELGHGKVKISFRSKGDVDVNDFARRFGGGGHQRASGALVVGTLDETASSVVNAAREYLRQHPLVGGGGADAVGETRTAAR